MKNMHGKYFDQFLKKKTDIDDNIHLKNYSESHFIWKLACLLSVNCIIVFSQQRTICIVNISYLASLLGYSLAVGLSKQTQPKYDTLEDMSTSAKIKTHSEMSFPSYLTCKISHL